MACLSLSRTGRFALVHHTSGLDFDPLFRISLRLCAELHGQCAVNLQELVSELNVVETEITEGSQRNPTVFDFFAARSDPSVAYSQSRDDPLTTSAILLHKDQGAGCSTCGHRVD